METWRLLPYDVGPSGRHFALSEALVRHGTEPSVWWHSTDEPTLILGPGQRRLDVSAAEQAEVRVVRRSAGGTAVYAGPGLLGQDVFLPAGHPLNVPDVVKGYRWLGEVWLDALMSLGVAGELVSIDRARAQHPTDPEVAMACFGSLSPYEVTVGERKLVGLAQLRRARGTLLQAGIHLSFDPVSLAHILPTQQPDRLAGLLATAAVGLHDVAPGPLTMSSVIGAVNQSTARRIGVQLRDGEWSIEELQRAGNASG